ncbi:MAG: DNA translocase FtsK [Nitrospinaceae bacterium]|nr:MAG: DNA translocase FtsK [Nitrospinaceae bacterium]
MNDKNFSGLLRDFFGILFVALTLFSFLSLITYSPGDPSLNNAVSGKNKVVNLGGLVGAYISDSLVQMFGTGAFFFPILTLILGWAFIRGKQFVHWPWVLCSGVLFLISLCALSAALLDADLYFGKKVQSGGMAGSLLGSFLVHWLNKGGAVLTLATFMFLALLGMTGISANSLIDGVRDAVAGLFRSMFSAAGSVRESFHEWREQIKNDRLQREENEEEEEEEELVAEPIIIGSTPPPLIIQPVKKNNKKVEEEFEEEEEDEEEFYVDEEELLPDEESEEYCVPPASLLEDAPEHEDPEELREEILANSAILEQKLADFGIQGRVVQVLPGPVITLFEYEPAPGIKVSRILGLSDDLALAMRATSLRILAPVPGKPVVGIEIPNTKKETVYFKEIINCDDFMESESVLPLAIGKDNIGQPVVQDLATIPHLLMAGSTGSGKSVGMNAMICSILLNASPDEVKMIMIDPKMLELSIYDGLPHLIAPVVTNPKKAAGALQWAVAEMEARYKMMAEAGVRNIKGFNEHVEVLEEEYDEKILAAEKLRLKNSKVEDDDEEEDDDDIPEPPMKLPYIVILIDELADLMMVAGKGVEECLTRLAQMARAAGIHLIVATQRPSVDVLTGIIKANFPARIAYKVISRVDSRTILDSMGADKLLGKGDMLFLPPGTSRLRRIHGCMVSDDEINRIVDYIKKQQSPDYEENIFDSVALEEEEAEEEEEFDEKYDEAVALVAKERQASISYIQRRMRIGYNRAARIVECMEREGVVGPSDGSRPREVYVKPILLED